MTDALKLIFRWCAVQRALARVADDDDDNAEKRLMAEEDRVEAARGVLS